ncbi:MAG: YceI family protein, partial [Pyrinomonadaceae bacterium]
ATKGEALVITSANSSVLFTGSKVTGKHEGGFTRFTGLIDLVNGKAEESSVSVDIDANSIFADDPKLTEHLKSPDFFDVAKFPKAVFKSTQIAAGAKAQETHTITGDLELHGQTKSVTFPATITVADDSVTVKAGFSINRKDFGIVYAGKTDDLIRDNVVLMLDVKAPRKK